MKISKKIYKKFLIILLILLCHAQYLLFIKYLTYEMKPLYEKNKNNMTDSPNKTLIELEKKELLKFLSRSISKNISRVKYIFLRQQFPFGNLLIIISRVIFYCQLLGCKKIIIENNKKTWFIKNKIIDKQHKLSILTDKLKNLKNIGIIIDKTDNFFGYSKYIFQKSKIGLLKSEILKNLPKVTTNKNDLYIYIRSGDIFINPHHGYVQPPFCYYKKILEDYAFKNIYLIAQNKNNPVINNLLKNYPYIIYKEQQLEIDISKLVHAYNLAGGERSTFFNSILELNINLQILFLFKLKEKPLNFSKKKNLIKFLYSRIKILTMFATNEYNKIMFPWNNTDYQRSFMNSYNCSNYFFL
jgi:hypothetical protein